MGGERRGQRFRCRSRSTHWEDAVAMRGEAVSDFMVEAAGQGGEMGPLLSV